jgi:hypothetical protein
MAKRLAMGKTVVGAPEIFFYDAIFSRWHWTYPALRTAPEWLLEDAMALMDGEAEGAKLLRAKANTPGHTTPIDAGEGESTASYAARKGLPMPPGGWPVPQRDS